MLQFKGGLHFDASVNHTHLLTQRQLCIVLNNPLKMNAIIETITVVVWLF